MKKFLFRLQVERNLLGSISPTHTSDTAIVGSSMPFGKGYAAIHHFGGKAGRGRKVTIPERPIFELIDEDFEEIPETPKKYGGY